MAEELLTVSEVARRKGVSRSAVYKAIAQGRLASRCVLDKCAIPVSEAEKWTPQRAGGRRVGSAMSAEGKARISAGQKQRWATRNAARTEDAA